MFLLGNSAIIGAPGGLVFFCPQSDGLMICSFIVSSTGHDST